MAHTQRFPNVGAEWGQHTGCQLTRAGAPRWWPQRKEAPWQDQALRKMSVPHAQGLWGNTLTLTFLEARNQLVHNVLHGSVMTVKEQTGG